MDKIEFERRNLNLKYVALGCVDARKDGSLSKKGLKELMDNIECFINPDEDITINLTFSRDRNAFNYGIYKEKD
jgi:hypothetical protein